MFNSDHIKMLALLSDENRSAFIKVKCDESDADLLVGIMSDAGAGGLDVVQAETRVNEHCDSRRNNATLGASVGLAGGVTLGGGDILAIGSEAASKITAHPAVTAAMDVLAGGLAVALVAGGMAAVMRLRTLRRQRTVLRRCARNLAQGEAKKP